MSKKVDYLDFDNLVLMTLRIFQQIKYANERSLILDIFGFQYFVPLW